MKFESDNSLPTRLPNLHHPRKSEHVVSCDIVSKLAAHTHRAAKEKHAWNSKNPLSSLQDSRTPDKTPSKYGHAIKKAYIAPATYSSDKPSRAAIKKLPKSSCSHDKVLSGSACSKDWSSVTSGNVPCSHRRIQSSNFVDRASFLEHLTRAELLSQTSIRNTSKGADLGFQQHHGAKSGRLDARPKETAILQSSGQTPMRHPDLERQRENQHQKNIFDQHSSNITVCPRVNYQWASTPSSSDWGDSCQATSTINSPSITYSCSSGCEPQDRNATPPLLLPSDITGTNTASRKNTLWALGAPTTAKHMESIPNELETLKVHSEVRDAVGESFVLLSSSDCSIKPGSGTKIKRSRSAAVLLPNLPSRKSSQQFRVPEPTAKARNPLKVIISTPSHNALLRSSLQGMPRSVGTSQPHSDPPARPSRQNTPDMKNELLKPIPVIKSNLTSAKLGSNARCATTPLVVPSPWLESMTSLQQNQEGSSTSYQYLPHKSVRNSPKPLDQYERKKRNLSKKARIQPSPSRASIPHASYPRLSFFGWKVKEFEISKNHSRSNAREVSCQDPTAGTGHEAHGGVGDVQHCRSHDSVLSSAIISGEEAMKKKQAVSNFQEESCTILQPSAFTHPGALELSLQPDCNLQTSAAQSTLPARRSVYCSKSCSENCLLLSQPSKTESNISLQKTKLKMNSLNMVSSLNPQIKLIGDNQHGENAMHKKNYASRKWNSFGRDQNWQSNKRAGRFSPIQATVTAVEKKPIAFYTMIDMTERVEEGLNVNLTNTLSNVEGHLAPPKEFNTVTSLLLKSSPELEAPTKKPSTLPEEACSNDVSIINVVASAPRVMSDAFDTPDQPTTTGLNALVVNNRQESISPGNFSRPSLSSSHSLTQIKMKADSFESLANDQTPPGLLMAVPSEMVENLALRDRNSLLYHHDPSVRLPNISQQHEQRLPWLPRSLSDTTIYSSSSSSEASKSLTTTTTTIPQRHKNGHEMWTECKGLVGVDVIERPWPDMTCSGSIPFLLETSHNSKAAIASDKKPSFALLCENSSTISTCSSEASVSSSWSTSNTKKIKGTLQTTPSHVFGGTPIGSADRESEKSDKEISNPDVISDTEISSSCQTPFSESSSYTSDDETPQAQVNLRVGSMTVTKWLTFSHVLFSDIRHEMASVEATKHYCILVIDGLGNDDWSFYIAETFQTASVFNLSPRAPLPNDINKSSTRYPLSPENHHQVQYASHSQSFPFAPHTFDVVVYRFPSAAPESHYRNIVMEARRVLRPHGFIELSALDLDLNNMGDRCRLKIRKLKEQLRHQEPDTSFSSTADLLVHLLGDVGFDNLKVARVGIPVASSITRKGVKVDQGSSEPNTTTHNAKISQMFAENSQGADHGTAKIVSRIGRWWYHRCYEISAGSHMHQSIWNDKELLSECKQLETTLKLMICCAKTPDDSW